VVITLLSGCKDDKFNRKRLGILNMYFPKKGSVLVKHSNTKAHPNQCPPIWFNEEKMMKQHNELETGIEDLVDY
jgi:hypothetical protein